MQAPQGGPPSYPPQAGYAPPAGGPPSGAPPANYSGASPGYGAAPGYGVAAYGGQPGYDAYSKGCNPGCDGYASWKGSPAPGYGGPPAGYDAWSYDAYSKGYGKGAPAGFDGYGKGYDAWNKGAPGYDAWNKGAPPGYDAWSKGAPPGYDAWNKGAAPGYDAWSKGAPPGYDAWNKGAAPGYDAWNKGGPQCGKGVFSAAAQLARPKSRSRSPLRDAIKDNNLKLQFKEEAEPAKPLERYEGAQRDTRPAWMKKGVGVGVEMFGEATGDLAKPGMTFTELEKLKQQTIDESAADPFADVFKERPVVQATPPPSTSLTPNTARAPLPDQAAAFSSNNPNGAPTAPVPVRPVGPVSPSFNVAPEVVL